MTFRLFSVSYSNIRILPPSELLCHTFPTPPAFTTPTIMITMHDIIMTTVCRKSIQITAFRPPCKKKKKHVRFFLKFYISLSVEKCTKCIQLEENPLEIQRKTFLFLANFPQMRFFQFYRRHPAVL